MDPANQAAAKKRAEADGNQEVWRSKTS